MSFLIPVAMFGWIFFSISQFSKKEPRDAAIVVVVGGLLFLPWYSYQNIPFLQEYHKVMAISFSLLIGELYSGAHRRFPYKYSPLDLPMIIWCTASPLATSLSNGLGLYNGIVNVAQNVLTWGVFYLAGRRYFSDAASMRKLTIALVAGGLIYFPLMAFEVRMSPQLSRWIYGFFPHSFLQHMRYGSFRPIVFMQHGLMVALWSAASAVAAYWLWRSRGVTKLKRLPMAICALAMVGGTVLCKSAGALVLMGLALILYSAFRRGKSTLLLKLLLLIPIVYISFRVSNVLPISRVEAVLVKYFDAERVQSAFMRMLEEDLFGERASQRVLFGWGGFNRGWPVDPKTGERLVGMIDALWIITYSFGGIVGLCSCFLSLGIGPWMVLKYFGKAKIAELLRMKSSPIDGIVLSLVVSLFIIDCLLNAMHNPFYILCAGALVSYSITLRREGLAEAGPAPAPPEAIGPGDREPLPAAQRGGASVL